MTAMPTIRLTIQFFTKPATMYVTNEIAAAVIAYGICVDTCAI